MFQVCVIRWLYMVVDLKVLVSSVYDDDPEHIKISFGKSVFLELAKVTFFWRKIWRKIKYVLLYECSFAF